MAWKPGQSGNPSGGQREKKFLAALDRAILQDNGERLRKSAEKLLDSASAGEPWAISMLADRLDGKPNQQLDMNVNREAKEMSRAEILERLATIRGSAADGATGAAGRPPEPSSLH